MIALGRLPIGAEFSPPALSTKRSAERYRVAARGVAGGVDIQPWIRIRNRKGDVYTDHWCWGPLVEWHASVQVEPRVIVSEAVVLGLLEAALEQPQRDPKTHGAVVQALAMSTSTSTTRVA